MKRPATVISYLRMDTKPSQPRPKLDVLKASPFPVWYFLALYRAVGENLYWTDMLELPEAELGSYCHSPARALYSLIDNGAPQGFFVLHEEGEITDLAYFGLTPQAQGKGWGGQLLDYAIATAWKREDMRTMTVNTCTLDHGNALSLYLSRGFVVTHEEAQDARL